MQFLHKILILSILMTSSLAYADDAKEAKNHYEKGMSFFNEQKYVEAEAEFKEAYNISGKSGLLYNLGICNEKIPDKEKAIAYFQLYLEELPDAPDSEDVKKRIEILKTSDTTSPEPKTTEAATEDKTETTENNNPENNKPDQSNARSDVQEEQTLEIIDEKQIKKERNIKIVTGVLISSGVLITASGFLTSIAAYNKYHTYETVCAPNCTQADKNEVRSIAIAADVQIVLGLATLTGGLVWYFVERKKKDKSGGEKISAGDKTVKLHPSIDLSSEWASISITGSF